MRYKLQSEASILRSKLFWEEHDTRLSEFFDDPDATYAQWDEVSTFAVEMAEELGALFDTKTKEETDFIDLFLRRYMFYVMFTLPEIALTVKVKYTLYRVHATEDVLKVVDEIKALGAVLVASRADL
jgi:hypothetical protein